mmetsp:Transcript_4486/g.6716  ORF Transcript_4486/g.6716 Transcript_4486/m.6716 type:complete len:127 (-) Transcript_4486:7761-8141(-)
MHDLEEGSGPQQPQKRTQRVADMTPEGKKAALKKFFETGLTYLNEGDFLDASDTIQKWRVARVVSVSATHVTVNYDGWPSKWDNMFRLTSFKVSHFRRQAKGYTGQNGTPMRGSLKVTPAIIQYHI